MNSETYISNFTDVLAQLDPTSIDKVAETLSSAINRGGWIFTCGNGGSASTASHYITDWGKMSWVNKNVPFKGMCLNDNVGMITAYGNDLSYSDIFCESISNYGSPDDILICVSGSGNSKNVVKATQRANDLGLHTIAIVGYDGGVLKQTAKTCVHVPSFDMQFCEDIHLMIGHIIMKKLC